MTWPAAVIAGAFLFLVGLALGVRRCPEVGETPYREDDDGIAPPDPWPLRQLDRWPSVWSDALNREGWTIS